MRRFLRDVTIGWFVLLLSSSIVSAQATAQLGGRVTDESGAVLPGVTVTVTQTDTGFTRTVVTDETGTYVMPNLPTGPYRLEASLQGFRSYVQTGIVLQVAATPTINVSLALGDVAETITVEGATPLIDVKSAGIKDVVENERILELPLQARQVTDLIVLAGAAIQTATADSRSMQGGVSISVAGGLSFGVAYLLDGAMHNNPQNNANLPLPFPDALQEFSVATSGLSAQNGMHSAASVNAVTKSGSNSYHGNLFEFLRDHRFNATNPFAAIGPDGKRLDDGLKRNQFGGTLGGPIVRDKLFFFGAYQGTATTQRPAANKAFVPTAAMMSGDFTAFASPACNAGRQVPLRPPFVNNVVNPALFSPAAVNLAKRLPTTTDPCGEVTYVTTNDSTQRQTIGRIDYRLTANRTLFGRYMATFHNEPAPFSRSKNVLTTGTPGLDNLAQSLAIGDTSVYGNNMVNAIRFAFNRTAIHRGTPPFFEPHDLGSNVYSYKPGEMVLAVTGGFNISAGTATTGIFITNASQLGDDLTLVRGNHQLGLGGSAAYWKMNFLTHARSGGNWAVNGQTTGLGLADFLIGRISSLEHGGPGALPMDMWYVGPVCAGYLADVEPGHAQLRPSLGAVLRAERRERRHLQLQPGQLQTEREEQGLRERAGRSSLPGRRRLSRRQNRTEEAVVEFLASRGNRVGCERRRPHGLSVLVWNFVRLSDGGTAQHQRASAAIRQPFPRRRSSGRFRQSLLGHRRRSTPNRHEREYAIRPVRRVWRH